MSQIWASRDRGFLLAGEEAGFLGRPVECALPFDTRAGLLVLAQHLIDHRHGRPAAHVIAEFSP